MGEIQFQLIDPLLPDAQANDMLQLCERYGSYGMYGEESIEDDMGEGLTQRHDAVLNFLKTGGRGGRNESLTRLAARTNYFREEYAYAKPLVKGIEPLLGHPGFIEASKKLYNCSIVEPSIVYANILVSGQELTLHTDVPEFRGINRKSDPQWLIVAMHHSGLFDKWRMRIATGVAWFGRPRGGGFVFYPDGPYGAPVEHSVRHNTAILLDSDSVFHGVDPVLERDEPMPDLRPGMHLQFAGDGRWQLQDGDEVLAHYSWDDLRFSISWKAYCYQDEAERQTVKSHTDDLSRQKVLDVLSRDLEKRGRFDPEANETALALTIIEEYIHFPPPAPTSANKQPS